MSGEIASNISTTKLVLIPLSVINIINVTVATWTGFKCQLCTLDTGQWTGLSKATDMDTGQTQGGAF